MTALLITKVSESALTHNLTAVGDYLMNRLHFSFRSGRPVPMSGLNYRTMFADGLNIEDDEPPPEPAPPEIPPRGHSLLRSSSTSLRKCSDYQLHMRGEVVAAQKHEEFIPQEKQQGECPFDNYFMCPPK